MICYKDKMESPIGSIYLAATDDGLVYCGNSRESGFDIDMWLDKYLPQHKIKKGSNHILEKTKGELKEYFSGTRKTFDIPLLLIGTEFRKRVWEALQTIPYGQSSTYGQIAKQIGNPKGARAIGQANHHNPISYLVP